MVLMCGGTGSLLNRERKTSSASFLEPAGEVEVVVLDCPDIGGITAYVESFVQNELGLLDQLFFPTMVTEITAEVDMLSGEEHLDKVKGPASAGPIANHVVVYPLASIRAVLHGVMVWVARMVVDHHSRHSKRGTHGEEGARWPYRKVWVAQ
tara:strand:- start:1354 stop:1809 length:456 start_codon:yes stop_codon:yes gene_type:complete